MNTRPCVSLALLLAGSSALCQTDGTRGDGAVAPGVKPSAIDKADPEAGREVYLGHCADCHGVDGQGLAPSTPDFTRDERVFAQGWNVLFEHAHHGYQSTSSYMAMPSGGGNSRLTDQDIWNALAYIRKAFRESGQSDR